MESSVVDTQLVKNVLTVRDSPHVSGIQLIEHFSFCGFKFMQFFIISHITYLAKWTKCHILTVASVSIRPCG